MVSLIVFFELLSVEIKAFSKIFFADSLSSGFSERFSLKKILLSIGAPPRALIYLLLLVKSNSILLGLFPLFVDVLKSKLYAEGLLIGFPVCELLKSNEVLSGTY